jgi:hypothetical protein
MFPTLTNQEVLDPHSDVLITRDYLRLVPSMPYKHGTVWCETKNPHKEWMVELSFSAYGRTVAGGEGFVFWYTENPKPPTTIPDFYGQSSTFKGLAVVFDTSDVSLNVHAIDVAIQSLCVWNHQRRYKVEKRLC